MNTIKFECEVITPMFLAGADGTTPELRPPSIKGMLRFWWRAMQSFNRIEELHKAEANIFGGADDEIGRSKFRLKVDQDDLICTENPKHSLNKLGDGTKFLYYSAIMLNQRPYFEPKSHFTINVLYSQLTNQVIDSILQSMWLTSFLGALGTRSRRGAGNFWITEIDNLPATPLTFDTSKIDNEVELKTFFMNNLAHMTASKIPGKYSTLKGGKLFILKKKSSWDDALESLGIIYKTFRDVSRPDVTRTPNFGIPVSHRNGKPLFTAGITIKGKTEKLKRRTSPLIFRVIKTSSQKYFPILFHLGGDFLPPNYEIMNKFGKERKPPSTAIIDEFIKKLPKSKVGLPL